MKYQKGQSGNPLGKPKGSADRRTALRALLAPHAEKLVRKAVSLALKGDAAALRICIDRLMAPLRATDVPITIAGMDGSPTQMSERVLKAMADGALSPDQATSIMSALSAQAKVVETDELVRRITALEEAVRSRGHAHG